MLLSRPFFPRHLPSSPALPRHLPSRPALRAVIAILPMFFEFFATVYYSSRRKERRQACHNPVLLPRGKLKPPKGACHYTLAYYLLGKKPMTEVQLVNKIHLLYIVCGLVAVALAFLP